jgi:hypothetical protein
MRFSVTSAATSRSLLTPLQLLVFAASLASITEYRPTRSFHLFAGGSSWYRWEPAHAGRRCLPGTDSTAWPRSRPGYRGGASACRSALAPGGMYVAHPESRIAIAPMIRAVLMRSPGG